MRIMDWGSDVCSSYRERKAESDALEDVQLSLGKLRISPFKAVTPDEADSALAPLYAHLPAIRITDLLAEVDRWTGFSQCFTHLQSGRVADEPRAILTAVLADATNLGHKRMAEARSEEHTSELQSLMRISYAVFCLKKKKNRNTQDHIQH